jgi:putative ABC transport system substrate-binding protein
MALLTRTSAIIALLVATSLRAEDTILVLRSRDLPQYNEAAVGFKRAWTGAPVQTYTLPQAVNVRATAVVAVGTEATQWAIKNTSGPVVFCIVANADRNVLSGLNAIDAARVRGVSLDIPAMTQLRALSVYVTKVKRVGVLYDPLKSGAAVQEMEQAAASMGIHLVKQEITCDSSLSKATSGIASQIDVLWAPLDSTVYSSRNAQFVLTQMLQRKVPVMGFSENMVKAGALLGLRLDYADMGRQTAALLQAALKGDRLAGGAVEPPKTYSVVINHNVQEALGNPIPPSALEAARFIDHED